MKSAELRVEVVREMGMDLRIHGGGYAPGAQDTQWLKRRQDYDALSKALSEGDLAGANDAYATIIGQLPVGGRVSAESFLGKMGVALRSADLALARQLMANSGNRNAQVSGVAAEDAASANQRASGDAPSPTLALNQAIQTGDVGRARAALQNMIDNLQQLTVASGFSGAGLAGARAYAAATPSVMAANNLLQNPNFRALEEAILRGDPTGMKGAWAMLMSGSSKSAETPRKPSALSQDADTSASAMWEMQSATVS
jgi:hypothetical protein